MAYNGIPSMHLPVDCDLYFRILGRYCRRMTFTFLLLKEQDFVYWQCYAESPPVDHYCDVRSSDSPWRSIKLASSPAFCIENEPLSFHTDTVVTGYAMIISHRLFKSVDTFLSHDRDNENQVNQGHKPDWRSVLKPREICLPLNSTANAHHC